MPDFSVIVNTPQVRAIVQQGTLERAFHDALFPKLIFRQEANPERWEANVGDQRFFTARGLIKPKLRPLQPGQDPDPSTYQFEQWPAQCQEYADSIDTHLPTNYMAIASTLLSNTHAIGMAGGQVLNRQVRNRLYAAGLSGQTVADGAQNAVTTLRVKRLNGFTRARRPDLAAGSAVQFAPVSASNPLPVTVYETGVPASRNVTGFTPDTLGDEYGPGTLTLSAAVTVINRDPVHASTRSRVVRVGGGNAVDAISGSDLFRLADVRTAVARLRSMSAPEHSDGRFHCHLDPDSEGQLYGDTEVQRLNVSLPEGTMYKDFAISEILGCIMYRNNETPLAAAIGAGTPDVTSFDQDDPFVGELTSNGLSTGVAIHRPIFVAASAIFEYFVPQDELITEAGIMGKITEPQVTNNGIEVVTDRIKLIMRAPMNRKQDMVSTTYKFLGDWPVRTDALTGDAAAFKREVVIEHGE